METVDLITGTVIRQKCDGMSTEMQFTDRGLEYTLTDVNKNMTGHFIEWHDFSAQFLCESTRVPLYMRLTYLIIFLTIPVIHALIVHDEKYGKIYYLVEYVLIAWPIPLAFFLLFGGIFRIDYTLLPHENGKLVVIKDAMHDQILTAIQARRTEALRAFARIDSKLSVRQNLLRLRSLLTEKIITANAFRQFQSKLLPGKDISLMRETPDVGPDRVFVQKFLGGSHRFSLYNNYVLVEYESNFLQKKSYVCDYPLKTPKAMKIKKTIYNRVYLAISFLCFMYLLALNYFLIEMINSDGAEKYGFAGFRNFIIYPLPIFLFSLSLLYYAEKLTTIVVSLIGSWLFVIADSRHDEIINEIYARGMLQHRAHIEPDPLMAPDVRQKLLIYLNQNSIITDAELEYGMYKSNQYKSEIDPLLDTYPDMADEPPVSGTLLH